MPVQHVPQVSTLKLSHNIIMIMSKLTPRDLNEKMMGYLIYRAGELEVSKSTVIGIKSCQL